MDDRHFAETTLAAEHVFDGKLLKVWRDRVRTPSGAESLREYVRHPGAVMTLACLPDGRLLFERQFRYPLHRVFLELPAGKIDSGEAILATAKRELEEETGYRAGVWRHLGTIHPCIGYSDERIEIFLARDLTHVGAALDEGEYLEVIELTLEEAVAAVFDGRITDAKTIAGLFWAQREL
jgi:ADP-ribose pyrophosphatase